MRPGWQNTRQLCDFRAFGPFFGGFALARSSYLFTSESVSEGHPDKVADQISDAVLDAILEQDPAARVAAETLVSTGLVVMAGEITTAVKHDYGRIARETIRRIGYNDPELRFDADGCAVMVCYGRQSPDIARGVEVPPTRAGLRAVRTRNFAAGKYCRLPERICRDRG